jgi:hypothetical protein
MLPRAFIISLMAVFLAGTAKGEIISTGPSELELYWKLRDCVSEAWESDQDIAICYGQIEEGCLADIETISVYERVACFLMEHTVWNTLAQDMRRAGLGPEPEPEGAETMRQMRDRAIRRAGLQPIILPGQTETSEEICAREHPDDRFARTDCETQHLIALTRHWITEMGGMPKRIEE